MKIIAIGAVTAGGKTTVVNAIKNRLPRTTSLHFDDYSFDGEVDDFTKWVSKREDYYNVWDLSPLKESPIAESMIICCWIIRLHIRIK